MSTKNNVESTPYSLTRGSENLKTLYSLLGMRLETLFTVLDGIKEAGPASHHPNKFSGLKQSMIIVIFSTKSRFP